MAIQIPQRETTTRFDFKAYQAALSFYGLPTNYNRVFKTHPMTNRDTGAPILDKDGKQRITLRSCEAAQESLGGNAVWVQVNEPFDGTAILSNTYPKKATNQEIAIIRNITLDFEYPSDPQRAHGVAIKLVDYLAGMGLVESIHPIEDSGAGPHIVMPIVPVETTPNDPLWNAAVAHVVKQLIEPEFNRLCAEANIVMDLEGFDISRIISCPGTWRPTNPKKADCEWLKEGYLRCWLAPYTDGNYPVRQENAKLSELIKEAYTKLKAEVAQNVTRGKKQLEHNAATTLSDISDNELIQRAMAAQSGPAFVALWYGGTGGYGDDWSSADLALCNKLAFWTGKDAGRMDRLFRQSGLMREKWDRAARTGETYGEGTIRTAIEGCNEVYDPLYHKQLEEKRNARLTEERDAMMYKEAVSKNGHVDTPHHEQEYIPLCKKHVLAAKEVPVEDIQTYMNMQQLGDAQLFAHCFEGQVAYDSFEKEWYLWRGHHWQRDMHDHIRVLVSGHLGSVYLGATKPLNEERAELAKEFERLSADDKEKAKKLEDRIKEIDSLIKAFIRRAKELRVRSYNTGVLYFAESLLAITTRDDGTSVWDSLTGKIGVKNGVLDLRTGICRDGEPNDYIRTVSPTEWKGINAQCPLFLKFLDGLFELREDKSEVIQFLIRLLGYALTGTCKEAIFAILYGPEGRNGKSTLFKIIIACLGKALAGSIAKELLIDTGKSQHANGPKPDVLDLQGKRIAIAAETKKGDKLNISAIKHYTGGDELGGRGVFGKHNIRFDPTHTLFLHTNFKPHADPGDEAFWARSCLIEFGMRFIENPDPNKPNERKYDTGLERRITEDELPGVLACLVRGAMDYDQNGLKKPQSVQLASEAYRVSEDTLQTFINECCAIGDDLSIQSSDFITAYKEWSGDGFRLTSKELKKQMEKKGFKLRRGNKANFYDGISFVGEGQDPSGSKNGTVEGSGSTEKACQSASEADLNKSSGRSGSSLCKVPHEDSKNIAATKLSETASTPSTNDNFNGQEPASEAVLQQSGRKNSPSTAENLLPPPNRACLKCGARNWQWDELVENWFCGGCNHG